MSCAWRTFEDKLLEPSNSDEAKQKDPPMHSTLKSPASSHHTASHLSLQGFREIGATRPEDRVQTFPHRSTTLRHSHHCVLRTKKRRLTHRTSEMSLQKPPFKALAMKKMQAKRASNRLPALHIFETYRAATTSVLSSSVKRIDPSTAHQILTRSEHRDVCSAFSS